ncbi:MAG: hypothetical protein KHZ01_05320 [Lachnospiraceae bacterium]|nr:hypothetical protein [Lachnospiraceae bacterium]
MKKYTFTIDISETYPELCNRTFTENQLKEVYRDIVDKTEYRDFQEWFYDMKKSCLIIEANVEMTEELSLLDSIEEIRQKAKGRPAEYPIDYTIRLITAMVASHMGYTDRTQWTELLKQCKDSKYSKRLEENRFYL